MRRVCLCACSVRGRLAWGEELTSLFRLHQLARKKCDWHTNARSIIDLHGETRVGKKTLVFTSCVWNHICKITENLSSVLCWVRSLAAEHVCLTFLHNPSLNVFVTLNYSQSTLLLNPDTQSWTALTSQPSHSSPQGFVTKLLPVCLPLVLALCCTLMASQLYMLQYCSVYVGAALLEMFQPSGGAKPPPFKAESRYESWEGAF